MFSNINKHSAKQTSLSKSAQRNAQLPTVIKYQTEAVRFKGIAKSVQCQHQIGKVKQRCPNTDPPGLQTTEDRADMRRNRPVQHVADDQNVNQDGDFQTAQLRI